MSAEPPESSSPNELYAHRLRKLETLREAGHHPYPNDFKPDITAAEVRAELAGAEPGTDLGSGSG